MLDCSATRLIKPLANHLARMAANVGVSANPLTVTGFTVGMIAALLITTGDQLTGAMCVCHEFFIELAYAFAALCIITTLTRVWWGWQVFR